MRKIRRKKKGRLGCVVLLALLIILIFALINNLPFDAGNIAITPPTPNPDDTLLVLINKTNKLPDDFNANLIEFEGVEVNKILVDDLTEMQNAAEKANVRMEINIAHRTKDEQEQVFNNIVSDYMKKKNSQNAAIEKAKQIAALPGYSEHETGLAIDFSFNGNDKAQDKMWDWLAKNAYKYGFILRYPEGKESITGYAYEPWHYRYVGKKHAKAMYEPGLVLEEYLNGLK